MTNETAEKRIKSAIENSRFKYYSEEEKEFLYNLIKDDYLEFKSVVYTDTQNLRFAIKIWIEYNNGIEAERTIKDHFSI